MFGLRQLLLCILVLVGGTTHEARAWFWEEAPLLTIAGEQFAAQDYRDWWQNWQEENMSLPASPDSFIDWHLLAQEGLRMQLDTEPGFQRKV
ncbi:MAG: hypothetical protein RI601_07860, partial [Desulfurivibrionaceae bacterium]|nr:hypothetical protein [Desulfurivibrionaceae bacterium]